MDNGNSVKTHRNGFGSVLFSLGEATTEPLVEPKPKPRVSLGYTHPAPKQKETTVFEIPAHTGGLERGKGSKINLKRDSASGIYGDKRM